MRRTTYFFVSIVFGLALLVQSCEIVVTYDIEVVNDTDSSFSVYLDDEFQFKLGPGGSSTIRDVDPGTHTLEARVLNIVIASRTVELDEDLKWTVYVDRYDVTVVNDTNSGFSVYLDGVFQFDLDPGDRGTITDVSVGVHTLEARIGNSVIADETVDVNQDIEWTVY